MAPSIAPYARAARKHLSGADPVLAAIIAEVGPCRVTSRPDRFRALARAIIFQQLAGRAAQTIHDRVVALYPGRTFPTPTQILATPDDLLRKAGLSGQKTRYIKDLARHVDERLLNFHRFAKMEDEEIIADLTRVKGIGRWTAEMFLMFNLGRPDVMPVGDLGVCNAVMRAYGMRKRPKPEQLLKLAERWRPYRSAAAWYFWQSSDITLPDGKGNKPAPKARNRKAPG
ncbi:MAG: DNA-3-methyladenine glycosylase family protein [Candidatus Binataceae bacterium]